MGRGGDDEDNGNTTSHCCLPRSVTDDGLSIAIGIVARGQWGRWGSKRQWKPPQDNMLYLVCNLLLRYGDVTLGFMWMWNARYFVDDKKWKTMDDQLLRFGKIYHR